MKLLLDPLNLYELIDKLLNHENQFALLRHRPFLHYEHKSHQQNKSDNLEAQYYKQGPIL